MTTTMTPTQTASGPVTTAAESLLALLSDSLSAIEEQDPDLLHSTTSAGSALLSLAGIARQAVGALGSDPGVRLIAGPGVVVVRDLVVATRLLARAASRGSSTDDGPDVGCLVPTAKGMHAALLEAMTAAA